MNSNLQVLSFLINKFIDDARAKLETEINEKKEKVLSEAEQLATSLVDKVTKGL